MSLDKCSKTGNIHSRKRSNGVTMDATMTRCEELDSRWPDLTEQEIAEYEELMDLEIDAWNRTAPPVGR